MPTTGASDIFEVRGTTASKPLRHYIHTSANTDAID